MKFNLIPIIFISLAFSNLLVSGKSRKAIFKDDFIFIKVFEKVEGINDNGYRFAGNYFVVGGKTFPVLITNEFNCWLMYNSTDKVKHFIEENDTLCCDNSVYSKGLSLYSTKLYAETNTKYARRSFTSKNFYETTKYTNFLFVVVKVSATVFRYKNIRAVTEYTNSTYSRFSYFYKPRKKVTLYVVQAVSKIEEPLSKEINKMKMKNIVKDYIEIF